MVATFAGPSPPSKLAIFFHSSSRIFQFSWMKLNFWGLHFWQNNKTLSVSMLSNHPKSKVRNWMWSVREAKSWSLNGNLISRKMLNNVLLCVKLKAFSRPLKSVSMSFCFAWDVFFSITGCRVFWRDGQVLSSRRWTDKLNKQLLHKHYAPPLQRDRIFYWVGMFFLRKDNNNQKKHCTYKCFFLKQ